MEYVGIYMVVFFVIGMRAFQQKVVSANQYPLMGLVGACIYVGEGTAVLMVLHGGMPYVFAGAAGAGTGVMAAVYIYNRYFINMFKKVAHESVPSD